MLPFTADSAEGERGQRGMKQETEMQSGKERGKSVAAWPAPKRDS